MLVNSLRSIFTSTNINCLYHFEKLLVKQKKITSIIRITKQYNYNNFRNIIRCIQLPIELTISFNFSATAHKYTVIFSTCNCCFNKLISIWSWEQCWKDLINSIHRWVFVLVTKKINKYCRNDIIYCMNQSIIPRMYFFYEILWILYIIISYKMKTELEILSKAI